MARSHGRLSSTQEGVGGKCTRRKTWGQRRARTRQDLVARHWGIVQQGAIWRNTTAGQWARIHLQMESSLLVWAWVSRKKRGEAERGFKCSNLHAWQGRFCSSRGCREGKGIHGCEDCVLIASNANIDKRKLVPTKTAIRPTTDVRDFAMLHFMQARNEKERRVLHGKNETKSIMASFLDSSMLTAMECIDKGKLGGYHA